MAEFDIDLNKAINDFKKLDDTVANMLKNAESLVAKLNNTPQAKPLVGANSKILKDVELQAKAITKMYQDMQKQSATLNAVIDKSTQGYIQNTQAMKAQTAEQRLHLTVTNEQLTKYDRLIALQKMAANHAIDMGLRYGQDSAIFQTAAKRSGDLGNKIAGLEQATGKMTGKMKNGYPAVFSFSQVLREMPNFAISARIGFMSLSNNIPMLADDFVRLKKTMDDTGKKMIGTKGAIKILAKELIGFNGIVILATTLVTLFATGAMDKLIDKMFKSTEKIDGASDAIKRFNESLEDIEGRGSKFEIDTRQTIAALTASTKGLMAIDEKTGKATKVIWDANNDGAKRALGLYENIKNYLPSSSISLIEKKGLSDIEKAEIALSEILKYYNQLIDAQYHLQTAEKANTNIQDTKINLLKEQKAIIADLYDIDESQVTKDMIDDFEKQTKVFEIEMAKRYGSLEKFKETFKDLNKIYTPFGIENSPGFGMEKGMQSAQFKYYINAKTLINNLTEYQKEYNSEIAKSMFALPRQDDKKGAGSGSYQRTMQEYDRMLDNYNWAKEALEQGIKMQEQIMNDETLTFEERLKAEKEYYNLKKILIKTETHKERQDAVSDFNNKVKDDNAKHQKNIESIKKNNEKAYTVTEEANNKIVQLTIDYSKKIQEAKTPEERTALREQYQKESAELSKHVIDVLGQQKSLTSEENEYLKAMAINRENLSNKTISLNIKENAELKEVFDERKENLKSIYDFEIELRNKILKSTEKQLIEENRLTGVLLSAARAQKGLEDLKNGKRIGFIDYSGLDATIDELNAFEREISALNIQLETSQSINNNYKLSLADMLGQVKAMSGGGNGALSLFQKEVEKLDESFSNGELTYSEYSEALKVLALNYLDKNKVIGDDERNLMNEIISNNEKIISSEEDVSNKKIALAIKVAEEKERLIKQVAEMEKKAYADLREGVVNVYDSILEYQDTRTENEINKIDEETEKKGELYDEQLSDLETLRDGQQMTDEEYEERRQVLEQQKQSFEEQQENRKKVLEKQMFERDKNQRMSQLLLETASALGQIQVDKLAYISALTKRNALMGTVGAVSAQASGNAIYLPLMLTTITSKGLALASIAASKYSAYAEGTDSVPRDEYAWVGDGGKNELMVSPSGEIAVTPNYPVLTKLKKGTRIYPDLGAINGIEAETLMRNLQLIVPEKDFDYNIFLSKFDEMIGVVKRQKTIVNIKPSLFDKASRKGLYS